MQDKEKEPVAEQMVSADDAATTPWSEVYERLADETTHWLATVRPDGRPHVVPVGAVWLDDALYFTTGQGTRKGKNLEHNAHCAIMFASRGYDLVIEGEAAKLHDEDKLQRLAEVYRANGWPATVRDGAFDAPYSAPTTGPAPYDVYEMTPTIAFAFGTTEETVNRSTRYRF
ncbi:MAG TPA: pyridoxamine 5'-phosphate oxidase family protein [Chloroflexia bacterium]|jgi:nitroimidazol reductase NimA-like FMN-containing flavoprotein (pyridoxamine 5'-phosphate oxidase superfamily)